MKITMNNSTLNFSRFKEPDFEGELERVTSAHTATTLEWIIQIDGVSVGDEFYYRIRGDVAMPTLTGRCYVKYRGSSASVISDVVELPSGGIGATYDSIHSGTVTISTAKDSDVYFQCFTDQKPNAGRKLFVQIWKV